MNASTTGKKCLTRSLSVKTLQISIRNYVEDKAYELVELKWDWWLLSVTQGCNEGLASLPRDEIIFSKYKSMSEKCQHQYNSINTNKIW